MDRDASRESAASVPRRSNGAPAETVQSVTDRPRTPTSPTTARPVVARRIAELFDSQQVAAMNSVLLFRDGLSPEALGMGKLVITKTDILWHAPRAVLREQPEEQQAALVAKSDQFVVVPRLSVATCVFFGPGSGVNAYVASDSGASRREHSIAVHQSTRNNRACLEIRTRDFLTLTIVFPTEAKLADPCVNELVGAASQNLYRESCTRSSAHLLYAATRLAISVPLPNEIRRAAASIDRGDGHGDTGATTPWFVCDMEQEITRQCASCGGMDESPVRASFVNRDFAICGSYPRVLFVPTTVSDAVVASEARLRTRGRVQTCTYVFAKHKTCLYRASQPKNGTDVLGWIVPGSASELTEAIRMSGDTQVLKVVDLRPYKNAVGNSIFRGGGHESTRRQGTEVVFANIENIDHVNRAFQELNAVCCDPDATSVRGSSSTPGAYLNALANSGWLDLLHTLLATAVKVARFISGRHTSSPLEAARAEPSPACNVMLHCSDGWDRTSQVSALAQILIDPWFRTGKGFAVLVEKEFVHMGHQFAARSLHPRVSAPHRGGSASDARVCAGGGSKESCPIFVQFIDAVHQLLQIYPDEFEFTDTLLLWLLDAYHSGVYASFAADNLRELFELNLVGCHTANAFTEIASQFLGTEPLATQKCPNALAGLKNSRYRKSDRILTNAIGPHQIKLWEGYFCRFSDDGASLVTHPQVIESLAQGLSVESFDAVSSPTDWQSVASHATSPNAATVAGVYPSQCDSPASPRPPESYLKIPAFQSRKLQETWS